MRGSIPVGHQAANRRQIHAADFATLHSQSDRIRTNSAAKVLNDSEKPLRLVSGHSFRRRLFETFRGKPHISRSSESSGRFHSKFGLSDRCSDDFRRKFSSKPLLKPQFRSGVFRQSLEEFGRRLELLKNSAGVLSRRNVRFSRHRKPFRTDLTAFAAKQTRKQPQLQLTARETPTSAHFVEVRKFRGLKVSATGTTGGTRAASRHFCLIGRPIQPVQADRPE